MIDLHTHTTASDGLCTPSELVARASSARVQVLSVTDHDTTAACAPVAAACATAGIEFVPGIEITAAVGDLDVHVLGYFLDEYFHVKPILGACGLLLGMILGVYRLTVGLRRLD